MNNKKNEKTILASLKESDRVLDIGGWARPFSRANVVIDINPYETRGKDGLSGGKKQYFSKKTWIIQDLSQDKKLPFKDKEFDFVTCSHLLEDIRDPIALCSEIARVAKRGYIEFPSIKYELSRGVEGFNGRGYVGNAHHRWLIEPKGKKLLFRMKLHFLNGELRYSIPYSYYKKMKDEDKNDFIFFRDKLLCKEVYFFDEIRAKQYFEKYISDLKCRSNFFWRYMKIKDSAVKVGVYIKRKLFVN